MYVDKETIDWLDEAAALVSVLVLAGSYNGISSTAQIALADLIAAVTKVIYAEE